MIGSSHCRRAKSPLGTVLILNLLGKGLTLRACMGDRGSIWWAPGMDISALLSWTSFPGVFSGQDKIRTFFLSEMFTNFVLCNLRKHPTFRDSNVWETSAEIAHWCRVTSQIWVALLIGWWSKFPANQKHYQDRGSDPSSLWNFLACSSDVISILVPRAS